MVTRVEFIGKIEDDFQLKQEKPVCSIEACVKEYPAATYLIACADVLNVLQLMQKKQIDKIHIIA